jgi:hypothetical protein
MRGLLNKDYQMDIKSYASTVIRVSTCLEHVHIHLVHLFLFFHKQTMPNQRSLDEVLERVKGLRGGPDIGSLEAVLRGQAPLCAGIPVDIRVATEGERAPNGREYHLKMRASTENVARDAGIIPMSAWRDGGLARFQANPVILAYHQHTQPIGISVHTEISKKDSSLNEFWLFHEESEVSRMMKKLYDRGFMRAASVGFIVHDFDVLDEKQEKALQKELGTKDPIYWTATRCELLETSAVPVPADPYALAFEHAMDNGRASGFVSYSASDFRARLNTPEEKVPEPKKDEEISPEARTDNSSTETPTEVETLRAEVAELKAETVEVRGLVDALQERLAQVETRGAGAAPKAEDTTNGTEARAEETDDDLVEIELRDGETAEQAIDRLVEESVAKVTGAPIAK